MWSKAGATDKTLTPDLVSAKGETQGACNGQITTQHNSSQTYTVAHIHTHYSFNCSSILCQSAHDVLMMLMMCL